MTNSDGEEEQVAEKILRAEKRSRERGFRRELLVKWKQYEEPNWEPRVNLEETEALDKFEAKYGKGDYVGESVGARIGTRGKPRKKVTDD